MRYVAAGFLLLLGASCSSAGADPETNDSGVPPLDENACCDAAVELATGLDSSISAEFAGPCIVDEDCAIDSGHYTCPGSGIVLDTSEIAYSLARETEFQAARTEAHSEICATTCCPLHLDNFYHYAYCRDGACRGSERSPDEYCPSVLCRLEDILLDDALTVGCFDDNDCEMLEPLVDCAETQSNFQPCPTSVLVGKADEAIAALMEYSMACDDSGFSCNVARNCQADLSPECLAGRCVTVTATTLDAAEPRDCGNNSR